MSFSVTLIAVATMLAYAIPAFALIKAKLLKPDCIPGIAGILLYICTPAIILHSFQAVDFSMEMLKNLSIFALGAAIIQLLMLTGAYLVIRKKSDAVKNRIAVLACSFGNCGFFGIPLLKALIPDAPGVVVYSAVYSILMNFFAFTLGAFIISKDKSYIKIRKILLNPSILPALLAIPLFLFRVKFPAEINAMLELLVKMSTPLCMFVLGMRLATMRFSEVFRTPSLYLSVAVKQLLMPLTAFALMLLLPGDAVMKQALLILACTPVASVVLNLSEVLGEGQEYAAKVVLLGTTLSILTIPAIAALLL